MSTDTVDRSAVGDVSAPLPALPPARPQRYRQALTALVAFGPLPVAIYTALRAIGRPVPWFDLFLMVAFLFVIGHAITIGFHRLFTHRSFVARRPLKISLAVLGSMAFQGSLIGWVADHRRHHRYADQPGDPHSPVWIGDAPVRGARGFWHAHVGWTFRGEHSPRETYAPDLLADPDLVLVDRMFVPCCIATLALPFAIGFAWSGTVTGAVTALVFAGIIRVGISHNATWAINSVCHRFGGRSFDTPDVSTNVRWLAPVTMGESWHNNHHAFPRLARHGVDRGQFDSSAWCIRMFEHLGWATKARWPDAATLDQRRVSP